MEEQAVTTFGKALRAERKRMDLTQADLAAKIDTSQQNIAGWEAGRALPRQEHFDKLVEFFGKDSPIAALPPRRELLTTNLDRLLNAELAARDSPPDASARTKKVFSALINSLPDSDLEQISFSRHQAEPEDTLRDLLPEQLRQFVEVEISLGRRADYWSPRLGIEIVQVRTVQALLTRAQSGLHQLSVLRELSRDQPGGSNEPHHRQRNLYLAVVVEGGLLSIPASDRTVKTIQEEASLLNFGSFFVNSLAAVAENIIDAEIRRPAAITKNEPEDEDWGSF